jgi:hypothetical protein
MLAQAQSCIQALAVKFARISAAKLIGSGGLVHPFGSARKRCIKARIIIRLAEHNSPFGFAYPLFGALLTWVVAQFSLQVDDMRRHYFCLRNGFRQGGYILRSHEAGGGKQKTCAQNAGNDQSHTNPFSGTQPTDVQIRLGGVTIWLMIWQFFCRLRHSSFYSVCPLRRAQTSKNLSPWLAKSIDSRYGLRALNASPNPRR